MLEFTFADRKFTPLSSGGLWMPESGTMVVADLHLGKSQSFAQEGNLLPPYDDRATLRQLQQDVCQYQPQQVWLLGDSFHHTDSPDRVEADIWDQLRELSSGRDWVWVTGNHDADSLVRCENRIPGRVCAERRDQGIQFTHQPEGSELPEVFGHFHPKVRVQLNGRRLSGKCFLVSKQRLLCPAYGAYTGGLWWPKPPLKDYFEQPRFLLCHKEHVREIREQSVITA